ncbi:MAG: phosphate/phosphite/phosphonate ABC transporter substrate-binding protein [Planctomycetota bacterium]
MLKNTWIQTLSAAVAIGALCAVPTLDRAVAADSSAPTAGTSPALELEKVRFVFQKQKDPASLKDAAETLGSALSDQLGVPVEVIVPGNYSASVQALVSGTTDVAYVSSLPFLLARRDGGAELILAEQRDDAQGVTRTEYDSLMVVPADSPLQTLDDLKAQASDTRFCFTSPTSTSGMVFAHLRLVREGILAKGQDPAEVFSEVSFGGGYAQALREVVAGRADVAAVSFYTMEGPKADVYLSPEERSQLRILARTPGVPTHVVCVRGGLDEATKATIRQALLAVAEANPDLLSDVYGTARFIEVDEDAHVAPAVEAVEAVGLPLDDLNKKKK